MASQPFSADGPDDDSELIRQIRQRRPPDLAPDKVAGFERRLRERLAQNRRAARLPSPRPILRWAFALALAAALMLVGAGAVSASAGSLPGELLYPVKRLSESAQIALTGRADRAELYTLLAERRLDEVQALAERGVVDSALLDELADTTELAVSSAETDEGGDKEELLQKIIRLSERQQAVLAGVAATAPEQAQEALARAQEVSRRGHERAEAAIRGNNASNPQASHTPPGLASTKTPPGQTDKATKTPKPSNTPQPALGEPTAKPETPPGQQNTPPGQQSTPPGQQSTPPGQQNTPPGQQNTPPGQQNTPPGQQNTPPGQQKTPPGQGGNNSDGDNGNGGGKP